MQMMNRAKKKILPYLLLSILFAIWLFSLLAVYIPTASKETATFPVTINPNMIALFLASSAILTSITFLFGLQKLGVLSYFTNNRENRKEEYLDLDY
jgi:hypothetical protein